MSGILHIVFCIDSEGPLYESLDALAERVYLQFGLVLEPTIEGVEKMRRGDGVPCALKEKVSTFLQPRLINNAGDWPSLYASLDKICSVDFRNMWPDSFGNGLAYSWFCLDHVGYVENPRRRIIGHHAIFDEYRKFTRKEQNSRDTIQFHYHPLPYNLKAHSCATYYFNGNHLTDILNRKIIERGWFPGAYRPGFHTLRPDSHWFLEQWIPFDFSNQACDKCDATDALPSQYGDWRYAPKIWGGYHPDHDDYQRKGGCRRWIFRCLNAQSRMRSLTCKDVREAFEQAATTGLAILAVTDHDFRDMSSSFSRTVGMIRNESVNHADVGIRFSTAIEAARAWCDEYSLSPGLSLELCDHQGAGVQLIVKCHRRLFGPQPWLAIKDKSGQYFYDNFDFENVTDEKYWSYMFNWQTFPINSVEMIGVAAPSCSGAVDIVTLVPESGKITKYQCNM